MTDDWSHFVVSQIRDLYKWPPAKRFFDAAAQGTNAVRETTIESVIRMAGIDRPAAISLARKLQGSGSGTFLIGRKGWNSRIEWTYGLRSLGSAARGEVNNLEEVQPEASAGIETTSAEAIVPQQAPSTAKLAIAHAKQMLAEALGVAPENIEITVRA